MERAKGAEWRRANPEHYNQYHKEYYEKNREKIRAWRNAYYTKKRDAALPPERRLELEERRRLAKLPEEEKREICRVRRNVKRRGEWAALPEEQRAALSEESNRNYKQKYHQDAEFRAKRLAYQKKWREEKKLGKRSG